MPKGESTQRSIGQEFWATGSRLSAYGLVNALRVNCPAASRGASLWASSFFKWAFIRMPKGAASCGVFSPLKIKLATAQKLLDSDLKKEAIKIQIWGNAYIHDTKKKDQKHYIQESRSKEVLLSVKRIIEALYV